MKNKSSNTTHLGARAEAYAERFLSDRGLRLLSSNFKTRFGEVDRVFLDGETLVFVEVRLRRSGYASASESVDLRKQRKLALAAQAFLQSFSAGLKAEPAARFDVLALSRGSGPGEFSVEWIQGAFGLEDLGEEWG